MKNKINENILKEMEKKIKGYGYDSLCMRYQMVRDKLAEYEGKYSSEYNGNIENARKRAQRDELAFFSALSDIIGEHY